MNTNEKNKLKHDLLNAIVIINSMTKSASNFFNQASISKDGNVLNQEQKDKFLYAMSTIRAQTEKIENYFQILLNQ
ncbi:hypothetical protein [Legionella drozanskii]|uniref:Uncharacterized protein n=1 Tax=Legionella drozanskii LLAP-1 TaxID=1212489 RepID=A0A0W0SWF7_9GAMM|nr:hypothetical protein [Legionella drozanskii]KTC87672.1 hypothetical protein Ldro_1291 [Legionella drozanskii LLAP-1]